MYSIRCKAQIWGKFEDFDDACSWLVNHGFDRYNQSEFFQRISQDGQIMTAEVLPASLPHDIDGLEAVVTAA